MSTVKYGNKKCDCGKKIKLNLNFEKCYNCHRFEEEKRGHYINMFPRKKRVLAQLPVKNFSSL